MNELIERLEAATGPDRELDALIRQAIYCPQGYVEQSPINGAWCVYDGSRDRSGRARLFEHWPSRDAKCGAFTASIDAALTLCGGESGLGSLIAGKFPDGTRGWVARVRSPETADGEGKTPALAICIASLRAHSTGMDGKNDD